MGFFDFFNGKNESQNQEIIDDVSPVNQILSTPQQSYSADPFDKYKDIFKTENFKNASVEERMNAYQALENKMAMDEGRAPRQVIFDSESVLPYNENGPLKNCAYYSNEDGRCIHMNPYYISDYCAQNGAQFDGMNSVIHEGRHAYQYDSAFGYADKIDADYASRQDAINKSLRNEIYQAGCQTDNITGVDNYSSLACERDAFKFANDTMKNDYFQEIYGGDPNFERQIAADSAQLNHMDEAVYRDEAINNILHDNPDIINQHFDNLRTGMSPSESFNQSFGGDEFENRINAETEKLRAEASPDQKSAEYTDKLINYVDSTQITPSTAQQMANDMRSVDPDFTPLPSNKSGISDENRYGTINESQNNDSVGESKLRSDTDLDKVKNDILDEHENNNSLNSAANYMDSQDTEDYAKIKTMNGSGNDYASRYPNGIQEYEEHDLNSANPYDDFLNERIQDSNEAEVPSYYDSENLQMKESGEKPEQEALQPAEVESYGENGEEFGELQKNDNLQNEDNVETLSEDPETGIGESQIQDSEVPEENGEKPEEDNSQIQDSEVLEENSEKPEEDNSQIQDSEVLEENSEKPEEDNSQIQDSEVPEENGEKPEEDNSQIQDSEVPEENGEKPEEDNSQIQDSEVPEENGEKPEEDNSQIQDSEVPEENGEKPEEDNSQIQDSEVPEENGEKPEEDNSQIQGSEKPEENSENSKNENSGQNQLEEQDNDSNNAPENSQSNSEGMGM